VHEGGPAYNAGIRPGDILVTVNGEVVTPSALPTFALGTDAAVTVRRAGEARDTPLTIVLPKAPANGKANAKPPMAEPTSVTARLLDEEIGDVRVAFFPGVNGQRFARELDSALAVVPPHVEVPLSPVELRAGRDTQLDVAMSTVRGK
jgi:C-terminal processing protease CtpA/Prc